MGDDPPYLTVGTEVSAKYKGAFCEAKIRKVVRIVKCKVTFKAGLGSALLSDDLVKGTLRVGATVEAKHSEKNQYCEATINKIQDCSQYTVVFDDGDITTLRRSALCLKSGRHFNESETLDQLPLTHPEHFSNPVVGGRRGVRRRAANTDADKDDSSDEEDSPSQKGRKKGDNAGDLGKVVCVEISEKKKGKDSWFPALVVCPTAQETAKIRVNEYLVRSFKDGRYYTVPKKEITAFVKDQHSKQESHSTVLKFAVDKVISYLDKDELPPHWDRDVLFGTSNLVVSDDQFSDSEASEEKERDKKDRFVAQLYKFMDDRGTPINKVPIVVGKDLDLYRLYNVVTGKGGYGKVSHASQWKPVTIKLGFGAMPSTSTINLVKQAYKKFLFDFEDFYKKLGCNLHTLSSAPGKPRNSRGVYRGGIVAVPTPKESKKEESEEPKKDQEEKEKKQPVPVPEPEADSASMDSDGKKSEQSDEPRRSRSRQELKAAKKDTSDDDKSPEKPPKKKNKKVVKEVEKEPVKEEPLITKAEPPSPAPSQVSQGSKKGRGTRKRKEKEEEPVEKEEPVEPQIEGLSKDVKVQLGDKLRVYYPKDPKGTKKVTYEAKVVDTKLGSYLVHYTGWNTRYDEWIERDRISENASLRTDYQTKSQGKGPSTQNQTPSEGNSESSGTASNKSTGGKGQKKKVLRTTPSAPTSSTGTRSKTGTIKRKRLSVEYEEPVKKKRVSKKAEKADAIVPSESDSEVSDSEQKNPPRTLTPPLSVLAASTSPARATKGSSAKDKNTKVVEEDNAPSSDKEVAVKGATETVDKEKQNQKIDMIQIRSEMKGLDKIVKSKSPSSGGSGGAPQPQTSPSTSTSGQKLDIYEFEEDPNEAPKLKMFSPRSPDKKDDNIKPEPIISGSGIVATKTLPPEIKVKESVQPSITVQTSVVPVTGSQAKSDTVTVKSQIKPITEPVTPAIPVVSVPRPVTPTPVSSSCPMVISPPPLAASNTQTRAIGLAAQSTFTPRGGLQSEPRVRMFIPSSSPPRSRAPTAPPPLVPSSSIPGRANLSTTPVGSSQGSVPIAPIQHATVPLLTPKPSPQVLVMPPLNQVVSVGGISAVTPKPVTVTSVPGPKDPKLLPFIARKQELFPHLIQQQLPGTPEMVSIPAGETHATFNLSHMPPISVQHEKVVATPSILTLTPHPVPQVANISQVPMPPESLVASSVDTKKEKKKRAVNKKAEAKKPPPPEIPTVTKSPAKKRAKPGAAKAAKALLALKAEPVKLPDPPVIAAVIKTSDSAPLVAFKQSEHPRKIAVSKQTAGASKSEKRTSPMKQHFLKGLASLEKEQRGECKSLIATGPKLGKTKVEEKPLNVPVSVPVTTTSCSIFIPTVPVLPVQTLISNAPIKESTPILSLKSSVVTTLSPKSSVVVIENLKKPLKSVPPPLLVDNESKVKGTQELLKPISVAQVIPPTVVLTTTPQHPISANVEPDKRSSEPLVAKSVTKETSRPLTPSFLTSKEELEPENLDETKKVNEMAVKSISEDIRKEEESCSSLLCEEEIPGSPAADDEDKLRFDFLDEKDKKVEKDLKTVPEPSSSGPGARVRGLPVNRNSESRDNKKKSRQQDDSFPLVEKIPLGTSFSSVLADHTPPSTPESTTLSTETCGSPHVDGGRISPSGEGASSKSKESTDGDSGDGSKPYYNEGPTRKSRKTSEPPPSPKNKRPRESRGRNLSPPAKRRRVPRRKSPEEQSRPFNYRGGRSSSGRKAQSGSDTHEVVKAPPPPPPINLGKPPKSAKFNYIPDLEGISDSEQRISLIMQAISSVREKYNEIKVNQQTIERRQKRRKKKERERAAERQTRQETGTTTTGS